MEGRRESCGVQTHPGSCRKEAALSGRGGASDGAGRSLRRGGAGPSCCAAPSWCPAGPWLLLHA
jgi:hypothetical protein